MILDQINKSDYAETEYLKITLEHPSPTETKRERVPITIVKAGGSRGPQPYRG